MKRRKSFDCLEMKNKKVINSVCFIRKYGTWNNEEGYAVRLYNLKQQIKLNNEYGIRATYMPQFDAMIDDDFLNVIKEEERKGAEIGFWFEVVKPLVEECGIAWRGRDGWDWDFHVNPGFLMAYTLAEKIIIIDTAMQKFKNTFGYYPRSVGSWLLDSESMEYMSEKYKTDAFIICREQWGMDGYTLWGGPYYGAYYPCKNNMQCPAQTMENQINTPVFRMFINDPIYAYYEYAKEKYNKLPYFLYTQEPAWRCGQEENWVKWQYDNMFNDDNSGLGFIQLGQENSFAWDDCVEKGLPMQQKFVKENAISYGLENMTIGEMGEWFKKTYKSTPSMAMGALTDWAELDNQSVWYNNKNYRINIFSDKENVWIRDIHIFDESFKDKYIINPCRDDWAVYDNPPVMDGVRFSDDETTAGIYLGKGKIQKRCEKGDFYEISIIADNKQITLKLYADFIELVSNSEFEAKFVVKDKCEYITEFKDKEIKYKKDDFEYRLYFKYGVLSKRTINSEDCRIVMLTEATR